MCYNSSIVKERNMFSLIIKIIACFVIGAQFVEEKPIIWYSLCGVVGALIGDLLLMVIS